MGSLKEVKDRITSVQSTIQITSAMKMVSAAKLKRAQDAVTQMRPLFDAIGIIKRFLTSRSIEYPLSEASKVELTFTKISFSFSA